MGASQSVCTRSRVRIISSGGAQRVLHIILPFCVFRDRKSLNGEAEDEAGGGEEGRGRNGGKGGEKVKGREA